MATTKIWPIKDSLSRVVEYARNPEKTDLHAVLHYAADGIKTYAAEEHTLFVSGINCNANAAFQEMRAIQERFGKTGGNVAYHAYQSFKPGEVTPELCHKLGSELARRMWGINYQVLVATHFNTGTYHNHLVVNSVGLWDGRKFDCSKRAYYKLRRLSDELCREYQLSVIENPKGKTPRSLYFAERNGEPTRYNLMREALDTALKVSVDGNDLRNALREQGYELDTTPTHKYATIKRTGSKKAVRLYRMGERYDLPALRARIEKNRQRYARDFTYHRYRPLSVKRRQPKAYRLRGTFPSRTKIGGLRGLYLHYCYCLGILPKGSQRKPLSPEMREACRRLESIDRQTRLLCRERLDTTADVESYLEHAQTRLEALQAARRACYYRLRRCHDPKEMADIRSQRDKLTASIALCRRDVKTAQDVLARSEKVKADLAAEGTMQIERLGPQKQRTRQREEAR